MTATVHLTDEEVNDLCELAHVNNAEGAVRTALDEYRRYARRMRLKGISGQMAMRSDDVEERAARGDWNDFDRIMERVPDGPPVLGDER